MIDATMLYHTSLRHNGILLHAGVVTAQKLKSIIRDTAPKRVRFTDGDILREVTRRDGTFEIDGWRIEIATIRRVETAW